MTLFYGVKSELNYTEGLGYDIYTFVCAVSGWEWKIYIRTILRTNPVLMVLKVQVYK